MQSFVFSNDTAATEIYTLSLHDALPICKRVVFGKPGAPRASVADAVTASCSIPWVFRPVEIGDREYVDGGAWSLTNLRSEEHTSELQSRQYLVCRLLLEKKPAREHLRTG